MRSEKLEFPGAAGHALAGRLELPDGAPRAQALFAHCFTCSKDVAAAGRISRALARRGVAVLRFDFTGLGNSEGDFENTDFSSNVADLVAAAGHLRREGRAPELLIGHSLGGAAVVMAAGEVAEARALVTIGAPSEPAHVRALLRDAEPEILATGRARVSLGGRGFTIRREFLEDLERHDLPARLRALRRALLVMHGPLDEVVGIDHARALYEGALHPKSFVSLDGADHLLSRREDSAWAAEVIAAWSGRYVGGGGEEAAAPRAARSRFRRGPRARARRPLHAGRAHRPARLGGGRARARRRGPRPRPLRAPARGARRVHLDDAAHVRRPERLAARGRLGAAAARPRAPGGLRRLRVELGADRPHPA